MSSPTTPIAYSLEMLSSLQREGEERVAVGFSGGKDSISVLDLAVKIFGQESVHPFYLYWVKGLECETQALNSVLSRYPKMPSLVEIPHYGLSDIFKTCLGRSFSPRLAEAFKSKTTYTLNDTERIARRRTGCSWILYGHRMTDSLQRRGMLNKCQGVWRERANGKPVRRLYPIFRWSPQDVFSYLKYRKLPIPDMFGADYINSNGVNLTSPAWLSHLQRKWPRDYARIKSIFPRIEDSLFRDLIRQKYGIENSLGDL